MTENSVSHAEVEKIMNMDEASPLGVRHIALGYLAQLRESKNKNVTLTKLHQDAVSALVPGYDYDDYVKFHNTAFKYLQDHAKEFGIKVE